jgi:hypothetical protein
VKFLKRLILGVFILSLLAFFCTQLKINKEQLTHSRKFENLYETNHTPYPLQNFIYLDSTITIVDEDGEFVENYTLNSASGIAVKGEKEKVYAFTAGHWCSVSEEEYTTILQVITLLNPGKEIKIQKRAAFFGKFYFVEEIHSDPINDVCVIIFSSPYAHKVKKIKPASRYPDIGEKVYTSSAPLGIFSHEMRLVFDGFFAGCKEDEIYCFYTIPGVQGSSGSGILNKRGELISILDVSVVDFHKVTGGAKLEIIKKMYEQYVR